MDNSSLVCFLFIGAQASKLGAWQFVLKKKEFAVSVLSQVSLEDDRRL